MFKNNKVFQIVRLAVLLLTPVVFWILPDDIFDDEALLLCPSKTLFDKECFACDINSALQHMHHFQWDDAVYYNILGLVIYPMLVLLWFRWTYGVIKRLKSW